MPPSHLLLVLLCLPLALAYPTSFNRFTFRSSPNVSPSVITPRASSAPAGWTYMGCFKDSPSRILSTKVTTSSSNTPTSCLALCTKSGFQYGGSEFGNECWCGNTLTSPIARPESDCNLPCSGDNTQTCGGSLALALYQVASTTTADLAYQGCYVDTSSPSRLLTSLSFTSKLMTPTMCKSTCLANGYLWYGLEYANQCYCATNLPTSAKKSLFCIRVLYALRWRLDVHLRRLMEALGVRPVFCTPDFIRFAPFGDSGWMLHGCFYSLWCVMPFGFLISPS